MTFSTSLAQLFCSSTSSIFEMYNMPGKLPYSHTHPHPHTHYCVLLCKIC